MLENVNNWYIWVKDMQKFFTIVIFIFLKLFQKYI